MKSSYYRADIDGLRAIAVLVVMFYHVGFGLFRGGYVGVDVFFVISGFLITRLIYDEVLNTKKFSFINFYERRARRLLPSFFFTMFVCFIFAHFLFSPQHFERFGGSLVHAVLSISNFYFWNESGYFDAEAVFKPLLHVWSLSVEEQFYLVWPMVLVFFLLKTPKITVPVVIVISSTISLLLSIALADGNSATLTKISPDIVKWVVDGPSTIFYLTPFRVYEFGMGAIIVFLIKYRLKHIIIYELLTIIGLVSIAYPVFTYTDKIVFPSVNALMPCFGAALIIYAGGNAKYSAKLFNNQISVGIGLISYSLYLIHWPIIVFYKYYKFDDITNTEQWWFCITSIIIAIIMYSFIEQPFRRNSKLKNFLVRERLFIACIIFVFIAIIPASKVWSENGWPWRFKRYQALEIQYKLEAELNYNIKDYERYVWLNHAKFRSHFSKDGKLKVLVVGDSMAANFINMLVESGVASNIDLSTVIIYASCQAVYPYDNAIYEDQLKSISSQCIKEHSQFKSNKDLYNADVVILASSWTKWSVPLISDTVDYLISIGVPKIGVVGSHYQKNTGTHYLAELAKRARNSIDEKLLVDVPDETLYINNQIKKIPKKFFFINGLEFFCEQNKCNNIVDEGRLVIYDQGHFTPAGAKYLGQKFKDSMTFKKLFAL